MYEPTLLSDSSGSPPQDNMHRQNRQAATKEVGNRYLKFELQRGIVACFKKFPPPCIIHDNINAAIVGFCVQTTEINLVVGFAEGTISRALMHVMEL